MATRIKAIMTGVDIHLGLAGRRETYLNVEEMKNKGMTITLTQIEGLPTFVIWHPKMTLPKCVPSVNVRSFDPYPPEASEKPAGVDSPHALLAKELELGSSPAPKKRGPKPKAETPAA